MTTREDFTALLPSKSLKRAMVAIDAAIGDGDSVEISFDRLAHEYGACRATLPRNARMLAAAGLVTLGVGACRRSTFARSDRWQTVKLDEIPQLISSAKQPRRPKRETAGRLKPRPRKVVVVEPDELDTTPQYQTPSLPKLRFMGEI